MSRIWIRRGLYTAGALAICGTVLGLYARFIEPTRLRVQRDTITGTGLPPLNVAVLADLHHGMGAVDDAKVVQVVRALNGLHADVIVLLGDYHSKSPWATSVTPERTAELLSQLHAPRGVYAVLGNHDHHFGTQRTIRALTHAGITVLENRGQLIPGTRIWLAGLSDIYSRGADPELALGGAPPDARVLAITHSPDVFPRLSSRFGLTLAGHTHGGQVRLPLLGSPWIPTELDGRYTRGCFAERGRQLCISSGVGTSILPIRFGVVPEIGWVQIR